MQGHRVGESGDPASLTGKTTGECSRTTASYRSRQRFVKRLCNVNSAIPSVITVEIKQIEHAGSKCVLLPIMTTTACLVSLCGHAYRPVTR